MVDGAQHPTQRDRKPASVQAHLVLRIPHTPVTQSFLLLSQSCLPHPDSSLPEESVCVVRSPFPTHAAQDGSFLPTRRERQCCCVCSEISRETSKRFLRRASRLVQVFRFLSMLHDLKTKLFSDPTTIHPCDSIPSLSACFGTPCVSLTEPLSHSVPTAESPVLLPSAGRGQGLRPSTPPPSPDLMPRTQQGRGFL